MITQTAENKPNREPFQRSVAGRKVFFDEEGFLLDFSDWSEDLFECLAKESGLANISDRHWQIIRFLRNYYSYNGRAPLHRQLREGTGMSVLEMEDLFPEGLKRGARRLAGLPNPKSC